MASYKAEIDVMTTYDSEDNSWRKREKRNIGSLYVYQANSDLAAGLAMLSYTVTTPPANKLIESAISVARRTKKVDAYIIDSLASDNGGMIAPFSLIGYIRVYDPSTPILALSYDCSPETVKAAFRYGATSFLPRPQSLELIQSVIDGLIANHRVRSEADYRLDKVSQQRSASDMIKISDSLFLDYSGRRLAFLDVDGVFTFSQELSDGTVSVLHCLAMNKGAYISSTTIARLIGLVIDNDNYVEVRKCKDRITKSFATIRNLIHEYDHYETVMFTSRSKLGVRIDVREPSQEAIQRYKNMKLNGQGVEADRGKTIAGFNLVELMEANEEVKQPDKIELEDLI